MPSRPQHISKALGNATFAKNLPLNSPVNVDWALVACFYSAMHWVEAYFAECTPPKHLRNHQTRDSAMAASAELAPIYSKYQDLKFFGYNARYEMLVFTAEQVRHEALSTLDEIERHIHSLL